MNYTVPHKKKCYVFFSEKRTVLVVGWRPIKELYVRRFLRSHGEIEIWNSGHRSYFLIHYEIDEKLWNVQRLVLWRGTNRISFKIFRPFYFNFCSTALFIVVPLLVGSSPTGSDIFRVFSSIFKFVKDYENCAGEHRHRMMIVVSTMYQTIFTSKLNFEVRF